jgi:hypothetical protein
MSAGDNFSKFTRESTACSLLCAKCKQPVITGEQHICDKNVSGLIVQQAIINKAVCDLYNEIDRILKDNESTNSSNLR